MTGPCTWPVAYRGYCAIPESWESDPAVERTDPDQILAESMAVEYLWNWTGRSLGVCDVVLRPCDPGCSSPARTSTFEGRGPYGTQSPRSVGWGGLVTTSARFVEVLTGCGACSSCQNLDPSRTLTLVGPVVEVVSVVIDGAVLPDTDYRLTGNLLVRTDGLTWPRTQDFDLASTETGTWEVTYRRGNPVPVGGQVAAGLLAVELNKAACGDKTCALPQRVQSITRQGVTVAVLDAFDDIDTGHTGIWVIDSWLASVMKSPRRALVYSPDVRPARL